MKRLLLIIFTLCLAFSAQAQITTEGTDFWFGFMENERANDLALEIYISASDTANVVVESPLGGFSRNVQVVPGQTRLVIPDTTYMPTGEGVFDLGFHVMSDNPVSVYQLNKRSFSADAAVIIPTKALDTEYIVLAHIEPEDERATPTRDSEFLVVATEDGTVIDITPSGNTNDGRIAGETFQITLDAGQTYQVQSEDDDLTGSRVVSVGGAAGGCQKIAVFGGNQWTNVGGCGDARDHLIEQMFPVSTWGEKFLYVPYATRFGGDYVKIVASEDETRISISGEDIIELDAAEYHVIKALDGVREVVSDKPIMFGQYSRSRSCDGVAASDPFTIIVSPLEQRVSSATFNAFDAPQINNYFLTLVTETDGFASVRLDGVEVSDQFITVGGAAYASIGIAQGDHTIESDNGVIAYVYGYGNAESFGYSAGVSLQNLNLQIEGVDEDIDLIVEQACVGSVIDFRAEFEVPPGELPRFNTFEWDFGNGDTADGEAIQYTFDTPGEYEIVMVASDGLGSCGNSETIIRKITVEDIIVEELIGPLSVCPDVVDIAYEAVGPAGNTYEWLIDGGNITSATTGSSITVDWGSARDDAFLKLIATNSIGCIQDTITYDVIINKRLEPALPQSNGFADAEVCFTELDNVTYFTPPTNGSEYEWFISAEGTINGANNSNSINVSWDGPGTGRVWYREFNPLISDCEGFSDALSVRIYDEIISTPIINNVLCHGESNATITLDVAGGKAGNYNAIWDNGMEGLSISGLPVGDYTATITDALGCEIIETYTVTEPDILEITDLSVLPVRCFQEANGSITLLVAGGTTFPATGDYQYTWKGDLDADGVFEFEEVTTSGVKTNFRAGSYTVDIVDANGCETGATFEVDEPLLLEADLETLINDPICPQANDGTAFIDAKGGTPDYQFYWSNNDQVDDANAENLSQGNYNVRIVDANGCETSLEIEVTERFPKIFVPNAFSPNGDGSNDEFKPVADCSFTFFMQIYNKWGSVVFTSEDVEVGWDGTYNGQPVQDGDFSYLIFYSTTLNNVDIEETLRGKLKLIR